MDQIILLQVVLLGVVEGLTEFIPVSSTGHLILLGALIDFKGPPGKVFEIVIQLGAIFAILWVYRQKLFSVVKTLSSDSNSRCFISNIIIAFLPAAILGATFHQEIKAFLFSPILVSCNLIIGGFIILWVERSAPKAKYNSIESIRIPTVVAIGFAQAISMIPGVSRSGATIIGSLCLGVDRKTATEFSFFLAIPTMLGASLFDLYMNWDLLTFSALEMIALGFVCAFVAGLVVVKTLVSFVSNHGFAPFAWYRMALGTVMLILFLQ